jgi:hypothetical protein
LGSTDYNGELTRFRKNVGIILSSGEFDNCGTFRKGGVKGIRIIARGNYSQLSAEGRVPRELMRIRLGVLVL